MFERKFTYSADADEFNLQLAYDAYWKEGKKRILILMQTVPTLSLKERSLLGPAIVRNTVVNSIKYARKLADSWGAQTEGTQFAVANFNATKHLQLKGRARQDAEVGFAKRAHEIIERLKPTHVLVSGDTAAHHMIGLPYHEYQRGWVVKKDGIKWAGTLDLDDLIKNDGEHADLLGFWCRHLASLWLGRLPWDLKDVTPTPVYCGTEDKAMLALDIIEKRIGAGDWIGMDMETRSLNVLDNPIYTIQFATQNKPDRGFVIPLDHPMTPFDADEIKRIKLRIRQLMVRKDLKLITMNGAFDIRNLRVQLRIPIVWGQVYDIQAGEHLLDENTYSLKDVGPAQGDLGSLLTSYGNAFYKSAKFGKSDRMSIGTLPPDNADVLLYSSMDVVCMQHMRKAQIKRAATMEHAGGPYGPIFEKHVIHIMGDTIQTLSHLKQDGSYADVNYLQAQKANDSDINREMATESRKLRNLEVGRQANRVLLREAGHKAKGLFENREEWIFSLSKPMHKIKLFIETMGLEELDVSEKTGLPKINKEFIAHYMGQHEAVEILHNWSKRAMLYRTFIKAWHHTLTHDPDALKDRTIKADYSFWKVATGRLSSSRPNLQQIPSRGPLAKIVKRAFVAPPGHMMVRFDYSAHEVRMWSVVSGDKKLAEAFKMGLMLRQKLIKDPANEEIRKELKTKGDIHIQNVYRFWKKWVSKDDPLRDSVKAIIFGLLYGKSAKSMGKDVGPRALARKRIHALKDTLYLAADSDLTPAEVIKLANSLKKKDAEAFADDKKARAFIGECVKNVKQEIKTLRATLSTEKADEKADTKYAQDIIDKTLQEFADGARWTDRMKELAEKHFYVYSPIGRRRHLYSALIGDEKITSRALRQGSNAPIQGFASELGVKAGRLITKAYYTEAKKLLSRIAPERTVWNTRLKSARLVHDACYFAVPYCMVLPLIHMLQYQATFGLEKAVEEELGVSFTVVPEIEVEVGFCDTETIKWDWTFPHLFDSIRTSVEDSAKKGFVAEPVDEVLEEIFAPYRDKKVRKYLNEKYPILNVEGMEPHALEALKAFDTKAKQAALTP